MSSYSARDHLRQNVGQGNEERMVERWFNEIIWDGAKILEKNDDFLFVNLSNNGQKTSENGGISTGWSNLKIDILHNGLGVEHKMLCYRSNKSIKDACGTRLMHPAATRSIRIPSIDGDATEAAQDVLQQYAELIDSRKQEVLNSSSNNQADIRTGKVIMKNVAGKDKPVIEVLSLEFERN